VRAIVTGAASGIGRAVALRFARDAARKEGARLVLVDRDAAALHKVCEEARRQGAACEPLAADLALPQTAQEAAALALERFGGLDALVSNAGIFVSRTPLVDMKLDDYERVFAVNTRATWLLAQQCRAMLRESRGCIVATASISADEPTATLGNYSATKAAVRMLVRQLAFELGPEGIRCNCVSPGTTRTGINDFILSDDAVRRARENWLPLRRVGQPEDIAAAIAFLTGAEAAYITGADLLVDGGLSTTLMAGLAAPEGG
jgi:NAD(P)-dependent dehydrogenase (short-subunit alcohol dehydrogenase family)